MTDSNPTNHFSEFALDPKVLAAVEKSGYSTPTPVQALVIPQLLLAKDVLAVAQTGTGKTAAFALPILSNLDINHKQVQVLCLTPTRELAIQVAAAFKVYGQNLSGLKVLAVYGGTSYKEQISQLKQGVHIVVGTPGRLMDLLDRKRLSLNSIKILVLDEADEMLRVGFKDDVEWILNHMPDNFQTALFSATMPSAIRKITKKYLNNPIEITVDAKPTTATSIKQYFLPIRGKKLNFLQQILQFSEFDGVIIFTRTKNSSNDVAGFLQQLSYKVEALNGDIAQEQREKIVARLKRGDIDIITATDVAARGLDVKRITLVINYDPPSDVETYMHRIGRTGRAGKSGDAILLVQGQNMRLVSNIERTTKQKLQPFKFPSAKQLNQRKIDKTFMRIDAELEKDLSEYQTIISQYLAHNPVNPELLAAAMANIEAKGKPFFIKDIPSNDFVSKPRSDKSSTFNKSNQFNKSRSKTGRNDIAMETFLIAVGENNGVLKSDIVGAIANEAGIESQFIGKIQLFSKHSLVDLPAVMPDSVFKILQKVRIKGEPIKITHAPKQNKETRKNSRTKKFKSSKKTKFAKNSSSRS